MRLVEPADNRAFEVEARRGPDTLKGQVHAVAGNAKAQESETHALSVQLTELADGTLLLESEGRRQRAFAARRGEWLFVSIGPRSFAFKLAEAAARGHHQSLANPNLSAPMPGKVLRILTVAGEQVAAGQPLLVLEAMKMETTLVAEGDARVSRIAVGEGQLVDAGELLVALEPLTSAEPQSAP